MKEQIKGVVRGVHEDFELITWIFLILDLLIYFDRGILPGLHEEVSATLHTSPELYFGVLQSTFIAGLAVTAPLLAFLSIKCKNLLFFVAGGLTLWNLSLAGCALAANLRWLLPLFLFRGLSGVGEAAFSSLVLPAMVDCQRPERKGVFLGIFYALMPVGVSLGFVISSMLPVYFGLSFDAAFGFLASAALPYVLVVVAISFLPEARGPSPWSRHHAPPLISQDLCRAETAAILDHTPKQRREDLELGYEPESSAHSRRGVRSPRLDRHYTPDPVCVPEWNAPLFIALLTGGAAQAAVNATLAAFGSAFLLDLGIFSAELTASAAVGGVAVGVGALGTFLGGLISQSALNRLKTDDNREVGHLCASIIFVAGISGSLVALVSPAFLYYGYNVAALVFLSCGLLLICMVQAPLNLGVMTSCDKSHRAMALSVYTLGIHFFGDVPGPVIIGWLKDWAESACHDVSEECIELRRGNLRALIAFLLMWTVFIWIGGAMALAATRSMS